MVMLFAWREPSTAAVVRCPASSRYQWWRWRNDAGACKPRVPETISGQEKTLTPTLPVPVNM